MVKWKHFLLIITSFLLISGYVPVNAQIDTWTAQFKLEISNQNNMLSANGIDEAKMNIVIINKTTNITEFAQSDVEVNLRSENGSLKKYHITILKGNAQSDDISLTSTEPGIAKVTANGVGFSEPATTSVEFNPPPKPSELKLKAIPDEGIMADGIKTTKLRVFLLKPDGTVFRPQEAVVIDISTSNGDRLPPIQISKNVPSGEAEYNTSKSGVVRINASSYPFSLENSVNVTFVNPRPTIGIVLAIFGGVLGGFVRWIRERGQTTSPESKKNESGNSGASPESKKNESGNSGASPEPKILYLVVWNASFGFIAYIMATYNYPQLNPFNFPYYTLFGTFMIGFIAGVGSDLLAFGGLSYIGRGK